MTSQILHPEIINKLNKSIMTKKRNLTTFMIAIMIMLFSLPANAQGTVGYAEWNGKTLTFKGGENVPEGAFALNTGQNYPGWHGKRTCTTVVFDESFKDVRPTSCYNWFYGFSKLTTIQGIENLNTAKVTDMSYMFNGCSGLYSLNLSSFNTANVWDMTYMFYGCSGLTSLDLSSFNTAEVWDMTYMFYNCSGLTSLNLSSFNTDKVTDMTYMFYGCSKLTSLDLSSFNTAKVTNMSYMFSGCTGLTSLNLSSFNTDKVTSMSCMFQGCKSLTSLDLSSFNTAKVTDMRYMFGSCESLTSLNLSSFNTAEVTDMDAMFFNCPGLTSLNLSSFNTDKVTNMSGMFKDCSRLTSLNLSSFNTVKVMRMDYMFYGCWSLTSLDLSSFNTAKVWDMSAMFTDCSKLTSLDLSSFNTAEVTFMSDMFGRCSKLTSLDLSSFNTAKVKWMDYMFYYCSGLTTIYVSDDFTTNKVRISSDMFLGCRNLKGAASYDSNKTDHSMAKYTTGYFKTYFTLGENKVELCGNHLMTESLDLSGDYDFTPKYNFRANTATYSRDLSTSESTWFSLCLPFAYTPQNFTAYQLQSASADAVEIEEITTDKIAAGTPVLFKFNDVANKVINISETKAQIEKAPVVGAAVNGDGGSSLQLCGTYQTKTFTSEDNNAFILLNDKLMNPAKMLENQNVTTVGVKPFRGYMTLTASEPQRARAFSIGHGDEEGTTAIDLLNSVATGDAEYYDINGRRIDAPAKGVNIVRRGNKTMKLIIK